MGFLETFWEGNVAKAFNDIDIKKDVTKIVEDTGNTIEAAVKTPIHVTEAVVTNVWETGESLANGDFEGAGQNFIQIGTEPLDRSEVGLSETAHAAGTDLADVGMVAGGIASTIAYGDPTSGMSIGSQIGKLGDKYSHEGEITIDDLGEATATSIGAYYGGSQGATMARVLYNTVSDGNLTEDEILNLGKQYAESEGYGQYISTGASLFQSVRDGELTEDQAMNLGMQYAHSQGYGDYAQVAESVAHGDLNYNQVADMGMQYAHSQDYGDFQPNESGFSVNYEETFTDNDLSEVDNYLDC